MPDEIAPAEQDPLARLEESLRSHERQIALLTKRVYQLEQQQLAAEPVPTILEQPAPIVAEPDPSLLSQVAAAIEDVPPSESDWESRFGSNWLNRAGIVLLVIGVALFLGYSLTFMGPAGKIAIGAFSGLLLLGAGYWFRRKEEYQRFALGLLAGGFAVLYATAYASYAVDAARIITNLYLGVCVQALVGVLGVGQAARMGSERASILAFLASTVAFFNLGNPTLLHGAVLPLTASALWLSLRMGWNLLPCFMGAFAWLSCFQYGALETPETPFGKPIVWVYWLLLEGFEVTQRSRWPAWANPLWVSCNALLFLCATFGTNSTKVSAHSARFFLVFALAQGLGAALRLARGIRDSAASEVWAVWALAIAAIGHFAAHDNLLLSMLLLALALLTLIWNRRDPRLGLMVSGEAFLALNSLALIVHLPETKLLAEKPLRIYLALPQSLVMIAALFAAGRWLSATPWPSWAALAATAVVTLVTIPQTLGTIVLALEAVLALAIGFYLARRPIRLGGLALFSFAVLKVFFYDLSELDTLPRIFSFIVLGLLLIAASWAYTRFREQLSKLL
jgi:uncharacterized membrane protein